MKRILKTAVLTLILFISCATAFATVSYVHINSITPPNPEPGELVTVNISYSVDPWQTASFALAVSEFSTMQPCTTTGQTIKVNESGIDVGGAGDGAPGFYGGYNIPNNLGIKLTSNISWNIHVPSTLAPGSTYYLVLASKAYGVNCASMSFDSSNSAAFTVSAAGARTPVETATKVTMPGGPTSITKSAVPMTLLQAYGYVTFIINYQNNTASPVNNYSIWDTLPYGFWSPSIYDGGTFQGNVVVWNLGTLEPGASGMVRFISYPIITGDYRVTNNASDSEGKTTSVVFIIPTATFTCSITASVNLTPPPVTSTPTRTRTATKTVTETMTYTVTTAATTIPATYPTYNLTPLGCPYNFNTGSTAALNSAYFDPLNSAPAADINGKNWYDFDYIQGSAWTQSIEFSVFDPAWNQPCFETGYPWITSQNPDASKPTLADTYYRNTFTIPMYFYPWKARLIVSSDDILEVWMNGRMVAYLPDSPAQTPHNKDVCREIAISSGDLRTGANVIAFKVGNFYDKEWLRYSLSVESFACSSTTATPTLGTPGFVPTGTATLTRSLTPTRTMTQSPTQTVTRTITATLSPTSTREMTLVKSQSASSLNVGGAITYTINYNLQGSHYGFTVWDSIPANVSFMWSSPPASIEGPDIVNWYVGTTTNASGTFVWVGLVNACGPVTNTAVAEASGIGTVYSNSVYAAACAASPTVTFTAWFGTATSTRTATPTRTATRTATMTSSCTVTRTLTCTIVTTPIPTTGAMQLSKTASAMYADYNDIITFSISYNNTTGSDIAGYSIWDTLPVSQVEYISASTPGVYSSPLVSWNLGTIAAGASGQVSCVVRVIGTNTTWMTICNRAFDNRGNMSGNTCLWEFTPTATLTMAAASTRSATPTVTRTVTATLTFTCTVTLITSATATYTPGCVHKDGAFASGFGVITHNNAAGGNGNDLAMSVIKDGSGKILVTGYSGMASYQMAMVVWKYNADGTPDTGFGGTGYVTYPGTGGRASYGMDIALDASGKIMVCGRLSDGTSDDMCVWRINADGTLDTTFNAPFGYATHGNAAGGNGADAGNSMAIASSGKIVIAGFSQTNPAAQTCDIVLWRFNTDGTLDTTFNSTGYAVYSNPGGGRGEDFAYDMKLDASGRILVCGKSYVGPNIGNFAMTLWRMNTDGSLDTTFNGKGYYCTNIINDAGGGLLVDPAGKILVCGNKIWRFNTDGTPDFSFNGSGYTGIVLSGARSMALEPDGKIIAAGSLYTPSYDNDMCVWRYNANGVLDTTFNGTGYVSDNNAAGGNSTDWGLKVKLYGNEILVAGYSNSAVNGYDMALWKYIDGCGTTPTAAATTAVATRTFTQSRTLTPTCTITMSLTPTTVITSTPCCVTSTSSVCLISDTSWQWYNPSAGAVQNVPISGNYVNYANNVPGVTQPIYPLSPDMYGEYNWTDPAEIPISKTFIIPDLYASQCYTAQVKYLADDYARVEINGNTLGCQMMAGGTSGYMGYYSALGCVTTYGMAGFAPVTYDLDDSGSIFKKGLNTITVYVRGTDCCSSWMALSMCVDIKDCGAVTPSPTATRTNTYACTPSMTPWIPTPTRTKVDTATATRTFTQTMTPWIPTATITRTATPWATNTPTGVPTACCTGTLTCDGITQPSFTVVANYNPSVTNNIVIDITSSAPLASAPVVVIHPHGESAHKPALTYTAVLVAGETLKYRVIFPRQTGYGDIESIIVSATDLCGIPGISSGEYTKHIITGGHECHAFRNVFNPDHGERVRVAYNIYGSCHVRVKVFNRTGACVKTVFEGNVEAGDGQGEFYWDGKSVSDRNVTSGMYTITVETDYYTEKVKVAVTR